jgi:hypothetical protein
MADKMVPLNTFVPEPLRTAVKIAAAREGLTMQNWVIKKFTELTEGADEEGERGKILSKYGPPKPRLSPEESEKAS